MSDPTTLTPTQFRLDLTAFADATAYPDAVINLYLQAAIAALNLPRFGAFASLAVEFMTAHYLVLDKQDDRAAAAGGVPGVNAGMISSKSVGPVSIGMDGGSSAEDDGGHWNLTTYGRRYLRLAREAGAGPLQLGGVPFPSGSGFPGSAAAQSGFGVMGLL
jgi:hypothetical protein